MTDDRRLILIQSDLERLQSLIEQTSSAVVEQLDQELSRADVVSVEALPPDVVTMNSTVVYEDEASGARREVTLCYPKDAKGDGKVSVLAPVGSALIGLSAGQSIDWPTPSGSRTLRIVAVPFQPQAAARLGEGGAPGRLDARDGDAATTSAPDAPGPEAPEGAHAGA